MALISIVIPVYNEQECLYVLYQQLVKVIETQQEEFEILFVDDGSQDHSRQIIYELSANDSRVKYVFLSRNFGHELAATAGIDHAAGEAVILMDADLQDPPEMIPQMIRKWKEGYKIVYGQRVKRKGERVLKKLSSWIFYRVVRKLSDVDIPVDTGDYRIMDRDVVDQFRRCREHHRFVRGLVAWTGFRQTGIPYERQERAGGKTKYSFTKLFMLAMDVILGFSTLPLRLGIWAGFCVSIFCLLMIGVIVFQKLFRGIDIPGYALIVTSIFFVGGIQLSLMSLLGEYLGRIYRESQNRPLYVISEKTVMASDAPAYPPR